MSKADEAKRLHAGGLGYTEIGRRLSVPRNTIRYWLVPTSRRKRIIPKTGKLDIERDNRPVMTQREIEDRERRYAVAPRDLTAAFFGDPLPGFSALDRFQSIGNIVSRVVDKLETQRRDGEAG